jgi:hypothetical protein
MPKPVLTIKTKEGKPATNVYPLKAGEHFPGFGGSRHKELTVGKTPSLIYFPQLCWRRLAVKFTEHDGHNSGRVARAFARLISDAFEIQNHGTGPRLTPKARSVTRRHDGARRPPVDVASLNRTWTTPWRRKLKP